MPSDPNYLLLIGAPKAGTTSLAAALGRHPAVVVSRNKEPRFFTDHGDREWTGPGTAGRWQALVRTRAEYEALFDDKPDASWRLDASTDYLSCPAAIERVAAFARAPGVGRVQVAVLLRDPVERAISQFQHTVRDGFEKGTLLEALAREEERRAGGYHPLYYHVERSRYAAPVAAWKARFPDMLILDYHALRDGTAVLDTLLAALDLTPGPAVEEPLERRNRGFVYRNRALGIALRRGRALEVARRLLPRSIRAPLRRRLERMNEAGYQPKPQEIAALRDLLAEDIAACVANPDIPTDRWRTAVET